MIRIGTMVGDALTSLVRPPVTERYPFVTKEAPVSLRGTLIWDAAKCTGCGMCGKDCPSSAIDVIVFDKKAKRFVLRYYVDRCTFCAQCIEGCRQGALDMAHDNWELASLSRDALMLMYGDPADVTAVLEGRVGPDAASADGGASD